MPKSPGSIRTIWNPAGFVEQKYVGNQTAASVKKGHEQLKKCMKAQGKKSQLVPILIDITEMGKTDTASHIAGVRGIKTIPFMRAAVYGPLRTQVLVNTLAIVAGKKEKIRAFESRMDALKWLLGGKAG